MKYLIITIIIWSVLYNKCWSTEVNNTYRTFTYIDTINNVKTEHKYKIKAGSKFKIGKKVFIVDSIMIKMGEPEKIDYYSVDNDIIVNAIYKAEGGKKTKYPYGIVSIDTKGDEEYARKICYNTVRNNKVRFKNQTKYKDYIEFLGSRYCPIGASNDPNNLNKNWVTNVKYFIDKELSNEKRNNNI